jgi:hypothetical protein
MKRLENIFINMIHGSKGCQASCDASKAACDGSNGAFRGFGDRLKANVYRGLARRFEKGLDVPD